MKLSNQAIYGLKYSHTAKARIMYEFNIGTSTIWRWITENETDGDLTKVRAVKLIAKELNMPEDAILIDDEETIAF